MEEVPELVGLIDTGFEKVILEPDNINEINEIARAAHSLKGGARSAGLDDIGNIALRVEKSFKALFNENINLDEQLTAYMRDIYQLLRQPLMARLENQDFDEKFNLDLANEMWAEFEEKYGEELAKAEEFLPSSSDLGIDIATSIFEVDVAQGISAVESAMDADDNTLQETLSLQTEIFTGFGEMLNLPGFVEICQITGDILQQKPEELRAIAPVFLDNIKQAHELVMAGDRETGGSPSEALLTLAGINQEETTPLEEYQEAPIDINEPSYGFFIEEAPELLAMMEQGLLTLKQERTTGKIHEIMRAAHSIKGGAASVGLEAVKTISHRLEDIIKVFYNDTIIIDDELETLLLSGFDCLKEALTEQLETGTYQPAVALANAQEVWKALENRLGDALNRPDDFIPSSEDLGVDIVESMFEIDVAQELERLQAVLSTPTSQPLAGELRATLEVFAGFGEMLNLSGFASIAHLGLTALENNPNQVVAIIETVIEDADKARDLVLAGDRTTGGSPSQKLIDLAHNSPVSSPEIEKDTDHGEEIFYLEEDNEQSNIEEVLSDVVTDADELINFALEDKETHTNSPSLDEVFGNQQDEFAMIESLDETEENEEESEIPSLEDIFTSEISPEEINLLSKASDMALEEDKNTTLPSLEDVFTTPDLSSIDISAEEDKEEESPSLEDVFGEKITFTTIENDNSQENEDSSPIPSIEELIGGVSGVLKDSQQTITPESFIPVEEEEKAPEENSVMGGNIEQQIESLQNVFDRLPGLKDEGEINLLPRRQKSQPTQKKQTVTPQVTPSAPKQKSNLTVRVDLERLERMNNLIGELSINRNGLSLQNDKLQTSVKDLLERFSRFQSTANALRELSDKMLTSPEKFNVSQGNSSFPLSISEDGGVDLTSAFDSLEMDRYDNLYYVVQGLIEQMIQLEESVDDIALYAAQSGQTMENQRQMLNRMRDELMWARMLPLGEVLNRFPRVLRDLSVKYSKKVNLKLSGTNVLVDKAALEKLYDPLVHLIRNGFDHGIETPSIRRQKGKSETGIIEVKAYHQGNQTIIEVKDDGGGLNLEKIGNKAVERGILTPEQLTVASKDNLLDLIFQPGFSTAASVTEISGRGVGLDIVRSQLRALKGSISVDSNPNQGTTFTLKLPLTLTIDKLLVLSAESQFYALPSDNIEEIVVPDAGQIKTSGNKRFLHFENRIIPIYGLDNLLHYRCHMPDISNITQALEVLPTPKDWGKPLLLIRQGQELFAIEVDHLVSEQELVIKPFGSALSAPSYTYGCTILGDGTLIPVVNSAILLENYFQATQPGSSLNTPLSNNGESARKPSAGVFKVTSVLVVDDSAAMRRTLALSLEKSGYRVLQAKDGKEALDQLQQTSNISLVICDIEMPNMNGFEFLGQRRRFPELTKIPVAMLTSRSNEKHQKLATHLGADAYFTKPYIEQKFLQAIKNLMGENALVN
ncbi:MAG: Hpt domain-containing protein [Cyanobacterium sp.]